MQRSSGQVFHHYQDIVGGLNHIIDGNYVGMIHGGDALSLKDNLRLVDLSQCSAEEPFEGNRTLELDVVTFPNLAVSASLDVLANLKSIFNLRAGFDLHIGLNRSAAWAACRRYQRRS